MDMYVRYSGSDKRLRCERHDQYGHHYAPHPSHRDREKMSYVLFGRDSLERALAADLVDREYSKSNRKKHPHNDGDPQWTPALGISSDDVEAVLRTRDIIVHSGWLRDALNTAAELGAKRERDRIVNHLRDRVKLDISPIPGIYPARQEPPK